tara:strand:- start:3791 stop:4483 length:693 start_codon:yes stop_codon:yes gene_type:complete
MSGYTQNQNSLRRWDNILANLRRDVANLKRLTLKGMSNRNLRTNSTGRVVSGTAADTTETNQGSSLGLGRVYLDNSQNVDQDENNIIIEADEWLIDFESPSNLGALLQDNHLFVVPNSIGSTSLVGKKVYIEVTLHIGMQVLQETGGNPVMVLELLKNSTDVISIAITGQENFFDNDVVDEYISLQLSDIVCLNVGDTLDVSISTNDDSKTNIENDSNVSYVTFNIIKIE